MVWSILVKITLLLLKEGHLELQEEERTLERENRDKFNISFWIFFKADLFSIVCGSLTSCSVLLANLTLSLIVSQLKITYVIRNRQQVSFLVPLPGHHIYLFEKLVTHGLQHSRVPCPLPPPRVCSNSCPLSQWCHSTIWSSAIPFSSFFQSFPALGSFPRNQFFASSGQSIGTSASASVLPMSVQGWFPLGWTGLISLLTKGLSRIFSNTTIRKHQFFSTQLSLWSNSHIQTWLLENP